MSLKFAADDPGAPSTKDAPVGKAPWFAATFFLVLLTEQTALGFTLIAPALGQFAAKFETTNVSGMITIFLLVPAVATPMFGKIGDRIGKKRALLIAASLGFVGAVVCALAPTYGVMLIGRALMGASGAFIPLAYSLVRDVFPENIRNLCIGIATNGVGVVVIVGPFLAGYLIDQVSLESVFWLLAAITVVGAVGLAFTVPETPNRNDSPMDLPGFIGLGAGLFTMMYGVEHLAKWGLLDSRTALFVGGSFIILAIWWYWERRVDHPFVDTRLLADRAVASTALAYALIFSVSALIAGYIPMMLQTPRELTGAYGFGLDASGVALYIAPAGVLTVLGGIVVGLLAKRYGFRVFLQLSGVLLVVSTLILGFLQSEPWMPILGLAFAGMGNMVYAAGPGLMMVLAPASSRGIAAAMLGAVGGAVATTLVQTAGLVLSKNIEGTVGRYPIYSSSGWTAAFLVGTVSAAVGFLITWLIPRREQQIDTVESESALVVKA
ncbi:MFS transporter [Rhodococcus sp. IEGM 1366]|uniref:MFS transporter n=1 Tax=Rhodococcus sp. IEGM 1366 TaxID=3082223 RepID=UPI002954575A|nr:MFS transporter [Rhodococcus sp. IEGM 1366]MDV8071334.1 MFS transporter [Rhodococcus sp. IEGM 1366]